MKTLNTFFAVFFGLAVVAILLSSMATFAEFMPPLPFVIGIGILLGALGVGLARRKFFGLQMVGFWACGAGLALLLGHATSADSNPIFQQVMYGIIPWAFVGCSALALLINATV